jgi:DNA-binding Lrp family transcriptional regulator
VAQELVKLDCISYVACSIGETDISVQVLARDTEEVYHLVTEVIGKIPGVRKTTTSIVPLVLKDVYQWRIPPSAIKKERRQKIKSMH